MAWTYQARGYKNIVVKVGGIIQDTPEIMYFPALLQAGVDRIVNRGFSSADYTLTGNSYSTPDNYYDTTALVPYIGDFDFYSWLDSIANGGTIEIWNSNIGEAFKFIFTKTDRCQALVSARYGSQLSSNAFYLNLPYNDAETYVVNPCCGFGFAFDLANYAARPVFLSIRAYKLGETVNESKYQQVGPEIYNNYRNPFSVAALAIFSEIYTPPTPSTDPYADGGYSTGTDTGTGTFDDTSESVPIPTSYAMSATASGLISQYVLTEPNLAAFGNWLWNGGSIVDDLKHFFASPMEAIFSVGMLPFTPTDTTQYTIYVASLNTGVTGELVGDTVEEIDCGTIDFDGYYGSALDFNPYTKIEIFLPYCGNFALNPDEVMGHTIGVKYYCDTVSGDCVAFIYDEDRVLYQVKGNCFVQIPLAARDFTAQYASAIGTVGTVAAGLAASVASGGMTAPIAVGMGTSVAANAMNAKEHIARAGGVSGMAGFMSIQTPYVIITVPNQCLPELQADHQGYPVFVTKRLGDFFGFTKVYEIHLDGLDCTDAEAKEIYDLLKGGVII